MIGSKFARILAFVDRYVNGSDKCTKWLSEEIANIDNKTPRVHSEKEGGVSGY